jgi:hypothetical protein
MISKRKLCQMYGLSYKTLGLRLKPIASKISYSSKRLFSFHEMQIIQEILGDPNIKHFTKKQLRDLQGVSYKILATWLKPVFGEKEYKKKRYFSPAEFELIAEKIGLPGKFYSDKNDTYFTEDYSLVKGRTYDPPVKWR